MSKPYSKARYIHGKQKTREIEHGNMPDCGRIIAHLYAVYTTASYLYIKPIRRSEGIHAIINISENA
jgi:hypothetical protein